MLKIILPLILILPAFTFGPAFANALDSEQDISDLADLAALYEKLDTKMAEVDVKQRELLEKMESVEQQRRELEADISRMENEFVNTSYRDEVPAVAADRQRNASSNDDSANAVTATAPSVVGADQKAGAEAQQTAVPDLPRISDTVGGVLTPRGRLVLEPSVRYVHSSVNRVSIEGLTIVPALIVGAIDVLEADRDTYNLSLTTRYGLTNRLEIEAQVPFLWRSDHTRTRKFLKPETEESTTSGSGSGLGDAEFGLRYQLNRGGGSWPYMVGNLRVKSTTGSDPFDLTTQATLSGQPQFTRELATGSGFWSVNPSMTFIYPSDPVVFFGNFGYKWTLEDDKGKFEQEVNGETQTIGFGKVDPGDAWSLNFGMGIGLNNQSSLSLSYALDLFGETSIETAATSKIAGSDVTVGRLLIGYSLRTGGGTPLNISVGIGATEDAPDADLNFRLPFNFFK